MSIAFVDPTALTLPDTGGAILAAMPEMIAGGAFALAPGSEGGGLSGFLVSAALGAQSSATALFLSEPEAWFEIPASLALLPAGGSADADAPDSDSGAPSEEEISPSGSTLLVTQPLSNETEGGETGETGDDDDGVTITGRRPRVPDLTDDGTTDGGGGAGDGGSGGTGSESEPNDCRDRSALDASEELGDESDRDFREHGSVIYIDGNGQLQRSPLLQGDEERIPYDEIVAWMAANGVSMSQVIGLVHNHPAYFYGKTDLSANVNRYPSGGVLKGGDWIAADRMVSGGAGGPNGANFALYVIDTDGKMREFEYTDREIYKKLSEPDRDRGEDLPEIMKDDGTSCG